MLCADCHQELARCRCQEGSGALLPPLPGWRRELQDRVDAYRARRPAEPAVPRVLAFPIPTIRTPAGTEETSGQRHRHSLSLPGASPPPPPAGRRPLAAPGSAAMHPLTAVVAEPVAEPVEAAEVVEPLAAVETARMPARMRREAKEGPVLAAGGGAETGDERCLQLWLPMASAAEEEAAAMPPVAELRLRLRAGVWDAGVVAGASVLFAVTGWASQGFPGFTGSQLRALLPALAAVPVALAAVYLLLCAYGCGETVGLRACGLRVVGLDGTMTRAAWRRRGWASVVSLAALGLGYAWVLCDNQRLSWHDAMSRTCIISEPDANAANRGEAACGGGGG